MEWDIEGTNEFEDWYLSLDADAQARIDAAVDVLQAKGPSLGRPFVGEVGGSRIHNLKELIPRGSPIRILFVFDPRRTAILLLGIDKSEHGWNEWYDRTGKPEAERLYDQYLAELKTEGLVE